MINFVSETVLVGSNAASHWFWPTRSCPSFSALAAHTGILGAIALFLVQHLPETNYRSLTLGFLALCVYCCLGSSFRRTGPFSLVVLLAGILIASTTNLAAHGVKMLGEVPRGLPALGLPSVSAADLNELLPLAMACFLRHAV